MKKSITKDKIKKAAIEMFNDGDTLSITTNHIAKKAKISPGNLYYHYKNKEDIIIEIYLEMSETFESFNSFELIATSKNPLAVLSDMFDKYGELFWRYKFLVRDMATLIVQYPKLKELFLVRQEKRIEQIEGLFRYFISEGILDIPENEIHLRAKLNWFISGYWHLFTSTSGEITKESISETKIIVFQILLLPYLTKKGKDMLNI
jgi:AcrR family transcriptional regulator